MKKKYKCNKCKREEQTESRMGLGELTCYPCPHDCPGYMLLKDKPDK